LYVFMGVSGTGKSTVGAAFARALGIPFFEGDADHPIENVERMRAGVPLTDADRAPWLATIAARLRDAATHGAGLVVTCSALRRSYRDVLRAGAPAVRFVHVSTDRALIAERLAARQDHFMPATLLDSQFTTLEAPTAEEGAWNVDASSAIDTIVADLVARRLAAAAAADTARGGIPHT
jgi:gluconokinase